jgi:hypothetical protein
MTLIGSLYLENERSWLNPPLCVVRRKDPRIKGECDPLSGSIRRVWMNVFGHKVSTAQPGNAAHDLSDLCEC